MTRSQLVDLVKEVMEEVNEANVTNVGGATFTPGDGAQYATPHFTGKATRAIKTLSKLGFKKQKRPKRPSHTKGFDYL